MAVDKKNIFLSATAKSFIYRAQGRPIEGPCIPQRNPAQHAATLKTELAAAYQGHRNLTSNQIAAIKYKDAEYRYNGQNRMVYAEVTQSVERSRTINEYAYDAYGRRTLAQGKGGDTMRTLYDGISFETVREGIVYSDGQFTSRYATGTVGTSGTITGTGDYEGSRVTLYWRWRRVRSTPTTGSRG